MSRSSAVTNRRLDDGKKALGAEEPSPDADLEKLFWYRNNLHDGIVALQSLDDLGSEEENQRAWDDMVELQKRYDHVMTRIKKLDGVGD